MPCNVEGRAIGWTQTYFYPDFGRCWRMVSVVIAKFLRDANGLVFWTVWASSVESVIPPLLCLSVALCWIVFSDSVWCADEYVFPRQCRNFGCIACNWEHKPLYVSGPHLRVLLFISYLFLGDEPNSIYVWRLNHNSRIESMNLLQGSGPAAKDFLGDF